MRFIELYEARRNPEQNPKISAVDALKKYEKDDDIYIHFTNTKKVGLNPHQAYYMPMGIFAYKYKDFYKKNKDDLQDEADFNKLVWLYYGTKKQYIYVLKAKKKPIDVKKYTQTDLKNDMTKLEKLYGKQLYFSIDQLLNKGKSEAEKFTGKNNPFSIFWYTTCTLAKELAYNKYTIYWANILRKMGYHSFVDTGHGYFHDEEKEQAIFMSKSEFKVVDMVLNKPTNAGGKRGNLKHTKNDPDWTEEDGTFKKGVWEDGNFRGGVFQDSAKWVKGNFYGGTFKSIWNNGDFYGGIFQGTWKNGTWHGGKDISGTYHDKDDPPNKWY